MLMNSLNNTQITKMEEKSPRLTEEKILKISP